MRNRVHFIGISGAGISALARVLLERGYTISGSDQHKSPLAESLEAAGVQFYLGHRPENVAGAEVVVRSSAVPDDNIEVQEARSHGIPVLKRAEFLGQLMSGKTGIAVAGTHGKTSTTAMIAWILVELGCDPSFILGGVISGLGVNARAGKGETFVIEADEYDRMFLGLRPEIAVITNVEHDHPDCYPTPVDFQNAFQAFIGKIASDGTLVVCGDDPGASALVPFAQRKGYKTLTYGLQPSNDYTAVNLEPDSGAGGFSFQLVSHYGLSPTIHLKVPGIHNVLNASAALVVAGELGLSFDEAALALSRFSGTGRRFEIVGEARGVTVISDYAHHPTEIRATLSAVRMRYPGRNVWAVWQPHTYSRTKLLFEDFCEAFQDANHVLVTEIFPAREPVEQDYSANQFVQIMDHPHAVFIRSLPEVVITLIENLNASDVLIVLSAGDADQICTQVLEALK